MKQIETANFLDGLFTKDVMAFKKLYQRYYKPLILFAMHFIDDLHVAEDIAEDVIVSIWERKEKFDTLVSFEGFIYSSVRNKCISSLRHAVVHEKYESEVLSTKDEYLMDINDVHEFEMQYIRLFEAIDRLPKRNREVILLYVDGMSNAEIAESLQLSIETVKTYRKKALAQLREKMSNITFFLFFLHVINAL